MKGKQGSDLIIPVPVGVVVSIQDKVLGVCIFMILGGLSFVTSQFYTYVVIYVPIVAYTFNSFLHLDR